MTDTTETAHADTDPLPSSDPSNSGNWVYSHAYSDEFHGTRLNPAKWQAMPLTYTPVWRWDASDVSVGGGNLGLRSEYKPNDSFNQTVSGWQTVSADGSWSPLADYITTDWHRTGSSALVHYNYWSYHVTTQQVVTGLTDGTYTFSAYVWTSGISASEQSHSLVAKDCGSAATSTPIPVGTGGWQLATLSGISVVGGSCTVGVESQSDHQGWVRIDDASFAPTGSSTNLLTNPGFETRTMTPYQSGGIISLDTAKYGYFEARIKASSTAFPGTCPAFWLEHIDPVWGNEIDIEEIGQRTTTPGDVSMTDHNWKSPTSTTLTSHTADYVSPTSLNGSFHTYGLEWAPGSLKFYVDGVLRRSYSSTDYDQTGLNIILSQGIRSPYKTSPTGTGFPADSQTAYIRVWKKADMLVEDSNVVRGAGGTQVPGDGIGENLFRYSGTWTETNDSSASGGTTHSATVAGPTSSMTFYGNGFSLLGAKAPSYGMATISIDGHAPVLIDEYAAGPEAQQIVYTSDALRPGRHTVTIAPTGTKNAASSDTKFSIDGLHIFN
ncbi:glycoside hydrolase family 16 protein [Kribbella aluminosa]|nr:glycoside hydrolase family 16 protein [Kribbella aluminosa]